MTDSQLLNEELVELGRQNRELREALELADQRPFQQLPLDDNVDNNNNDASKNWMIRVGAAAVFLLATAATATGVYCGGGRCVPTLASRVPAPTKPPPTTPSPTTPPPTGGPRAEAILDVINNATLTGRTLRYPSDATAEERAVMWLVDEDAGTAPSDVLAVHQRYALTMKILRQ